MSNINEFVTPELLTRIENTLNQILTPATDSILLEAIHYSCLNGGKRVRPLLVIASGKLNNADLEVLIDIGVAIELIHCYSLIHDDLSAMDNDNLRRGKPTCHIKYNDAIAILAGDALQLLAFQILSSKDLAINPINKLKIINLIATFVGVSGLVGGQALDLTNTGKKLNLDELQTMHKMKTGSLIKAAILSGYLCGDLFNENAYLLLNQLADNLGLLFQITDDILDVTSDTTTLGKTANIDLKNKKATYVSTLGLSTAKSYANSTYQNTIMLLNEFQNSSALKIMIDSIYSRIN